MNAKHTLLITSSSALAAGVAQAAVHYNPVNIVIPLPPTPTTGGYVDLDTNGIPDFGFGFEGYTTANHQKPFVFGYPNFDNGSAVLARYNATAQTYGVPVASFGTRIDQNYLPANLTTAKVFLDQDGNGKYVGDWLTGAKTEGYIGLELFIGSQSITNFGWAHVIFEDSYLATTPMLSVIDCAYEDGTNVSILAGATNTVGAPIIYSQPQSQIASVGEAVQMQVTVLADPAPSYQWKAGVVGSGVYTNLTDSGPITGSTSATLNINGALAANALDYIVVITNTLGAVTSSPPAALSLVQPVATPTPQVLLGGLTGRFHISVANGLSATYHWRQNSAALADSARVTGSTTPNLAIANLQTTDNGNYDVVLTSGSLSVTSTVASLTVLSAASLSTYETALAAARPVAYYRLNETSDPSSSNAIAFDNAGGFNGVYGLDVTNGMSGIAGPRPSDGFPGFAANNLAARFATNDLDSFIILAPWQLNANTVTFTAWINPANPAQTQINGIVATGSTNNSFAGIRYYFQANAGNWDLGYAWQQTGDASLFYDSQISPPANEWSLVGLVVTPSDATIYEFNNGGVRTAVSTGVNNLPMPFEAPAYIGTIPDGLRGARNFEGTIDEVAVFNRAMGSNDLQALYNAALGIPSSVTLQIQRTGNNLQLTWGSQGQLLEAPSVNGPWTTNSLASSPYPVSPTNSQKFYRVLVR